MKNPKNNFTIIPNWLVDELSSGAEFSLYCKMYNGWCLMKDPDGWYYRSLSKLKEDLGMSPKTNNNRLIERIKRFEELGILMVERCDRQTNRYKFNEDYMFNHEEDTADEGSTPEGYEVVPQKGTSVVPETGISLVPETGTVYNTVSNNTVKNKIYKEKEINKEKESNTAGQGSLRNDGVSISSLTNEGDNFIRKGTVPEKQLPRDYTFSNNKNKTNTSKDMKELQIQTKESNSPCWQGITPPSSAHPPLTDKVMTKDIATSIIDSLGEYYAEGASIIEHQPNKFMVELQHEIPYMDLTNIAPNFVRRYGVDIRDFYILRKDDGRLCSEFEMYFNN